LALPDLKGLGFCRHLQIHLLKYLNVQRQNPGKSYAEEGYDYTELTAEKNLVFPEYSYCSYLHILDVHLKFAKSVA
jgi:hypothetical protein